jgi:hypothetical protein
MVHLGKIPEGQLRPLSKLEPQQQREAWKMAIDTPGIQSANNFILTMHQH